MTDNNRYDPGRDQETETYSSDQQQSADEYSSSSGSDDRKRIDQVIPDLIRKTFSAGLGVIATSEESIRKIAGDMSLPKEVVQKVIRQAESTKGDISRVIQSEFRHFLANMDVSRVIRKAIEDLDVDISVRIRSRKDSDERG